MSVLYEKSSSRQRGTVQRVDSAVSFPHLALCSENERGRATEKTPKIGCL